MNEIIPVEANEIIPGEQPLDQNPAAVYLSGLKPSGRRTQQQGLNMIAEMLGYPDCFAVPWAALRFQHTQAVKTKLEARYSAATVNRFLCALRKTLKAAWRLGQIDQNDYLRAVDLESVRGETIPSGRNLASGEISALMGVCEEDPSPAGARDAAIIALAYSCGLRRDELASLERENYDPETGELKILHAKRNKQRMVYLVNGAADAMADWLDIRGNEPGPLFWRIIKGGALRPGQLTDQAIYTVMQKRARQAGVRHFSPHDFRRTCAGDLLDAGVDIATVAAWLGHEDTNTTRRYDRRGERVKKQAVEKLHVPYRKKSQLGEKA